MPCLLQVYNVLVYVRILYFIVLNVMLKYDYTLHECSFTELGSHCGVGWDWGCSISWLPGVGGWRGQGRHGGPQQHLVHLWQPGRALCSCLDEINESFNFSQNSTCELWCVIHIIVMFPSAILTPDHRSVVEDHRWCDDAQSKVVDDAGDELSESWKICRYGI